MTETENDESRKKGTKGEAGASGVQKGSPRAEGAGSKGAGSSQVYDGRLRAELFF